MRKGIFRGWRLRWVTCFWVATALRYALIPGGISVLVDGVARLALPTAEPPRPSAVAVPTG